MFWESPVRIIDDFERSSISPNDEYTSYGGGGWDTRDSISWGSPLSGSRVAHVNLPTGDEWYSFVSQPGDGLEHYPAPGDSFHVGVAVSVIEDSILRFGWAGTNSQLVPEGYSLRINMQFTIHTIELFRYGEEIVSADLRSNLQPDTWYDIGVDWASDNTFDITLRKNGAGGPPVGSLTHQDTTYTEQGAVSFTARNTTSAAEIYFDNARITH